MARRGGFVAGVAHLRCHVPKGTSHLQGGTMLRWAVIFFIIAIIAGIFGFGGIASESAGIAKILFTIFLIIFVVTLILGLAAGKKVV
jgi:uncharacterized membrane protein YtjA (UPF0391 family)